MLNFFKQNLEAEITQLKGETENLQKKLDVNELSLAEMSSQLDIVKEELIKTKASVAAESNNSVSSEKLDTQSITSSSSAGGKEHKDKETKDKDKEKVNRQQTNKLFKR